MPGLVGTLALGDVAEHRHAADVLIGVVQWADLDEVATRPVVRPDLEGTCIAVERRPVERAVDLPPLGTQYLLRELALEFLRLQPVVARGSPGGEDVLQLAVEDQRGGLRQRRQRAQRDAGLLGARSRARSPLGADRAAPRSGAFSIRAGKLLGPFAAPALALLRRRLRLGRHHGGLLQRVTRDRRLSRRASAHRLRRVRARRISTPGNPTGLTIGRARSARGAALRARHALGRLRARLRGCRARLPRARGRAARGGHGLRGAVLLRAWNACRAAAMSGRWGDPLSGLAACTRDRERVIVERGHHQGLSAAPMGALMPATLASRAV